MAGNTEQIPATSCSVPGEDPPVPATADGGEEPKNKDPDMARQPKRKKNCPTSLDKLESLKHSSPNSTFSFTFDTNFSGTPEFTPRFGSFNSTVAAPETDRSPQIPATSKRKAEAEEEEEEVKLVVEEEEKSEVREERREIEGTLSSIVGVEESSVD